MPVSIDRDAVAALLREVAASEVLPRFRNLAKADVRAKTSAQDLVTLADLEAERVLTARLPALLPGSVVVGEEAAYADPRVLERLDGETPVWVIDPVDGTANFSAGRPTFAMIVALVDRGQTVAGWILDPLHDRMALAERGAGAWLGDTRIQAHPADGPLLSWQGCAYGPRAKTLKGRVGATSSPRQRGPQLSETVGSTRSIRGVFPPQALGPRGRCAAVARGRRRLPSAGRNRLCPDPFARRVADGHIGVILADAGRYSASGDTGLSQSHPVVIGPGRGKQGASPATGAGPTKGSAASPRCGTLFCLSSSRAPLRTREV